MKTTTLFALLLLSVLLSFAQTNKFEKGDFGMSYLVTFNGTVTQGINLSGMATPNLEIGAGITFNYSEFKSNNTDSANVNSSIGTLRVAREIKRNSNTLFVGINPYVLYHFPVKSNLDIYVGPQISAGISGNLKNDNTTTNATTGYNYRVEEENNIPVSIIAGGSIIAGCKFFFYKKLALGLQGSLGVAASIRKGTSHSKATETRSGEYNFNQGQTISNNDTRVNETNFNTSSIGSIGLNLTFYFGKKANVAGTAN